MKSFKLCTLVLLLQCAGLSQAAAPQNTDKQAQTSLSSTAAPGLDLSNYDPSVRVQDDLFRATNGGWLKRAQIPASKGSHGSFEILRDESDAHVRAIVERLAAKPQQDGSNEQKIGSFYASFMDTAAIDQAGLKALQPQLQAIADIADRQQLAAWLGRQQGVLDTPVNLYVAPDAKEPLVNRVRAIQGGLGLPERDYFVNRSDKRMAKARADYLHYLSTLARLSGEAKPAEAAKRVLALEHNIAELHWDAVANRDVQKTFNPMTPA